MTNINPNNLPLIMIISGPTASGKSELSLEMAKKLNGEIVNIDSVQLYKHFDIGSAKLSIAERKNIPHHLIDILEPDQEFSVADYKVLADQKIAEIIKRNKLPIFVGGSTQYIRVLLHGLPDNLPSDISVRNSLDATPLDTLVTELKSQDPNLAETIDLKNKRRVVRALESIRLTSKPVSIYRESHKFINTDYRALMIVLQPERQILYQKINNRTKAMIDAGLVEETKSIISKFGTYCAPLKSIGYREVVKFINKEIDEGVLLESISQSTRNLAKKQLTFWNNEPRKRDWNAIMNICSKNTGTKIINFSILIKAIRKILDQEKILIDFKELETKTNCSLIKLVFYN